MVTLVTVRLLPPVLVTVIDNGDELEAAGVPGNASADVESVAVGGVVAMADELDEQPASNERNAMDTASPEMR